MKKLTTIALNLIIITGLFQSCDDKVRELEDLNSAPSFQYFRRASVNWETPGETPIIDSAKAFTTTNNATYPAILRIIDINRNATKISIKTGDAENSFFVNDNVYYDFYEVDTGTEFNVAFRNKSVGTYDYRVSALDDFDASRTVIFRVTYNANKAPISKLSTALANAVNKTYSLNAQNSFDRDQAIGGAVVEYQYLIDNIIINTSQSLIYHNFTIGTHQIQLRVKDNDDVWSEYVTKTLVVT